jgi:uncharacterized coiled-coil protein SlyX
LSGALVGTFAFRLYSMKTVTAGDLPARRPTPEEFRRHYVQDLSTRTKMDADQIKKLNDILDEMHTSFDQLRSKLHGESLAIQNHQVEEINAMLRPDQKDAYAAFRADREKQRQLRNQKNQNKK